MVAVIREPVTELDAVARESVCHGKFNHSGRSVFTTSRKGKTGGEIGDIISDIP